MPHRQDLITEEGFEKLKTELKELQTVKRENVRKRIKHARSFCDFLQDSEYEDGLKEQVKIENRIRGLEETIQNVSIHKQATYDKVEFGSEVTLRDLENETLVTYVIVGSEEAEPSEGKISINSPFAIQILGYVEGDYICIKTLESKKDFQIIHIS